MIWWITLMAAPLILWSAIFAAALIDWRRYEREKDGWL